VLYTSNVGLGVDEFVLLFYKWFSPDDVLISNILYTPSEVVYHRDTTFQHFESAQDPQLDTIISSFNCTDTILVTIPLTDEFCFGDLITAFTPNNDGVNDSFRLLASQEPDLCNIQESQFKIFDRSGNLVFNSLDAFQQAWTGTNV
jgi:gliding motility-associated-like protein